MTPMATGFWVAMTPLTWVLSGYSYDRWTGQLHDDDSAGGVLCATVFALPLWWALYFAIGMLREAVG